jgi:serine/threonine protein phosphatase 1
MSKFIKFKPNTIGKDYVVGDIHGAFFALEKLLKKVGFDKTKDRLFSVGDLVDRGIESHRALEFLQYPWFHAISGNHEQIIIKIGLKSYDEAYPKKRKNRDGNHWFFELTDEQKTKYIEAFKKLPIIIQIGNVGLVHAYPLHSWETSVKMAKKNNTKSIDFMTRNRKAAIDYINGVQQPAIKGIGTVIVGHTIVKGVSYSNNVIFLDTGYYEDDGALSVVELSSMDIITECKNEKNKII